MKVLVVDDERPARERLVRLLGEISGIEVAGEAANGLEAAKQLAALQPDLLLLDIEMPGLDGLALASRQRGSVPVVFVTAHETHAVRAFELQAVDYLLKPVRRPRLVEALERARTKLAAKTPAEAPPRVTVHAHGVARFFDVARIERFSASHKYTAFSVDGEEHLTDEPLAALEARLGAHGFVRVHRGELVRTSAVVSLGQRQLVLASGAEVPVSKRLSAAVRAKLKP